MKTIKPNEIKKFLAESETSIILDVRTAAEFATGHLPGAINLPLDQLNSTALKQLNINRQEQVILTVCQHGKRGENACRVLKDLGFNNIYNITGGTSACQDIGLAPKIAGVISLERQVRIGAGVFVLIGVLGSFFYSGLLLIAGLVGAGLVFAGVTDTCGLAWVLGKMPWNQTSIKSCCSK